MGICVELWCPWGIRIGSRNAQLRQSDGIKYLAPGEISFCLHWALPRPDYRRLATTHNQLPVLVLTTANSAGGKRQ